MPQCEMCGATQPSLTSTKVEGAELDLCDDCIDFGTAVESPSSSSDSTKYSTSSDDSGESSGGRQSSGGSSGGGGRRRDMFDDMDEIVPDYDERIRSAREERGLSRDELAGELNEKASQIRKLERGEILPSDDLRQALERRLELSLVAGGPAGDDDEWSGDGATSTTLGDVVERED